MLSYKRCYHCKISEFQQSYAHAPCWRLLGLTDWSLFCLCKSKVLYMQYSSGTIIILYYYYYNNKILSNEYIDMVTMPGWQQLIIIENRVLSQLYWFHGSVYFVSFLQISVILNGIIVIIIIN